MKTVDVINSLNILQKFLDSSEKEYRNNTISGDYNQLVKRQHPLNNWHTETGVVRMFNHLTLLLSKKNLELWINRYRITSTPKVPVLVKPNVNYSFGGIHEWLCCMITQTPFILKATENQFQLIRFLSKKLIKIDRQFEALIDIGEQNTLKPQQFILHSDKNQSITQYFKGKKALIVEPRPSIAILTGDETLEELYNLGTDIFLHLGQTSGTLRKVYVPEGFDIKKIFEAIEPFSYVYQNNKYANNYDYHQSVYLMEQIKFLDNGFVILKEDNADDAPTGCLFYEYYQNMQPIINKLRETTYENIICTTDLPVKTVKPGQSHFNQLWEYPNGKDIIDFLLK